ncbi:hypothetical protein D3C81_1776990 [compost metagenome]
MGTDPFGKADIIADQPGAACSVQSEQPFGCPRLQIQMLIHQPEQMQLAVLTGEFSGTAEHIHAVGNAVLVLTGDGASHNMDTELTRQP